MWETILSFNICQHFIDDSNINLFTMLLLSVITIKWVLFYIYIYSNEELIEQTYNFNRYMILAVYLDAIFVDTKVFLNG